MLLVYARGERERRGSVLGASLIALVVFVVLLILAAALLRGAAGSLRSAGRERDRALTVHLAESGAELGLQWLRSQPSPAAGTEALRPAELQNVALADGTISVEIVPFADNAKRSLRVYQVVGEGKGKTGYTKRVVYQVQEESFAQYAYFVSDPVSPVTGSPTWFTWADRMDGPVHGNAQLNIAWQVSNPAQPIFLSRVTTALGTPNYYPAISAPEDYAQIYKEGQTGHAISVAYIPMPEGTTKQQEAAWGSVAGFPTATGVYLRASQGGGVYICGTVQSMVFASTPACTQVTITQQPASDRQIVTTLAEDHALNKSTIESVTYTLTGSEWQESVRDQDTQPTVTNGLIYCDDTINGLQGVIAGAHTIAVASGKDIVIVGDLTLADSPVTNPASTSVLGLIAQRIVLDNPLGDLSVQAILLAGTESGGGYVYNKYWNATPRQQGTFHLFGSLLQAKGGPMGKFSASTNTVLSGYTKDYRYDTRMQRNAPPLFPTTGRYRRVGWQRL